MGIELKISELVDQANAEGVSANDLRKLIRKRELAEERKRDVDSAEQMFNNPQRRPGWEEVKEFIGAPVQGEGQLGAAVADIKDAVRRDDEKAFYKAAFMGIRMMIRQAYPMGHRGIGE